MIATARRRLWTTAARAVSVRMPGGQAGADVADVDLAVAVDVVDVVHTGADEAGLGDLEVCTHEDALVRVDVLRHRQHPRRAVLGAGQRYAADFSSVTQEVIQHLGAAAGVELEVRLEITARAPDGFTEQQMRTVRENAAQLRFEQSGFEES